MSVSYELGTAFTWINTDYHGQSGWWLDSNTRAKIADGSIKNLMIALSAEKIKAYSLLGGIEIVFNSEVNGFCTDSKAFPWCLDKTTAKGGWIKYTDLVNKKFTKLDSDIIYVKYELKAHPRYSDFKAEMASAKWAQITLQYRMGISTFPFVNAYLQESSGFSLEEIQKNNAEVFQDTRDII